MTAVLLVGLGGLVAGLTGCRSEPTPSVDAGASTTRAGGPAGGARTPTTRSPDAELCFQVNRFQYVKNLPESGRPSKDPLADQPAEIVVQLRKAGALVIAGAPELADAIRVIEDDVAVRWQATPSGTQPGAPLSVADANAKVKAFNQARCATRGGGAKPRAASPTTAASPGAPNDGGGALTMDEFRTQADGLCRDHRTESDAIKARMAGDMRGSLERLIALMRDTSTQIKALGARTPEAAEVDDFVAKQTAYTDELERAIPAILENPSQLVQRKELLDAHREVGAAAAGLGLTACT